MITWSWWPVRRLKPGAESDARAILGYLLLREMMGTGKEVSPVLVELTDPSNADLFGNRHGEIIVSPLIVSHILARVALRRELRAVFDELFSASGSEILFRRIGDYGLAGTLSNSPGASGEFVFADLQHAADALGEIAIGVRRSGQTWEPRGGVEINPGRDERLQLNDHDELIVLTT